VFTCDGGRITLHWCDYGGGNGIKLANLSGPVTVSNCEIHDTPDSAVSGGQDTGSRATIEDNFIHDAESGLSVSAPGVIQRNCITGNQWGLIPGGGWGLSTVVKNNSIFDSTNFEVYAQGLNDGTVSTIDLSGNYWGGTVAAVVEFRTLGFDDEPDWDQVVFEPVLTSDVACGRWG
jgi:hypothetical protein